MNSADLARPLIRRHGLIPWELLWPFVWRCAGAAGTFLSAVMIARLLGAEQAGWVALGQTTSTVAAAVAALGVDLAAMRSLSAALARGSPNEAGEVVDTALCTALVAALIVCGSSVLVVRYLEVHRLFFERNDPYVSIGLLAAFGIAVAGLYGEFLRAVHKTGWTSWFQNASTPLLLIAGLSVCGSLLNSVQTLWLYAACALTGAIGAGWLWREKWKRPFRGPTLSKSMELLGAGVVMSMITVGTASIGWIEMLALSHWNQGNDIALLYAGQRIATLVSFPLAIINIVAAPRFAALYAVGDFKGLKRYVMKVILGSTALGVPVLIVLMVGGRWILDFYGPGYVHAYHALDLLLAGQLVNLLSGPVIYLLMMCHRERLGLACVLVAVIVDVMCVAAWVPRWGLMGAAASSATALAVLNLLSAVFAYRLLFWEARAQVS